MPEQSRVAPSRRTLLGLVVLGASVSGCSVEVRNPFADHGSPSTAPDADTRGGSHDLDIAAQALGLVESTLGLVVRVGRRHPALRERYAALRAMHRAHAAALADAVPDRQRPSPAGRPVPRSRSRAGQAVAAAEDALGTQLAALAQRVASGDFARLLASMSASVAQHRPGR